jgi:hypothetical protein
MFSYLPRGVLATLCILADIAVFTVCYIVAHFVIKYW